jgi:hypothetical protein
MTPYGLYQSGFKLSPRIRHLSTNGQTSSNKSVFSRLPNRIVPTFIFGNRVLKTHASCMAAGSPRKDHRNSKM